MSVNSCVRRTECTVMFRKNRLTVVARFKNSESACGVCLLAALVSVRTPEDLVRSQGYKSINSISYVSYSQN